MGCALSEALEPAYQSRYTFLPCRRVRGVPGPPGAFRSNGSAYRRAAKNRLKDIRPREHGLQKPAPYACGCFSRRRPHITTPPKNSKGKAKPPFSFEKSGFVELLGRFELPTSSLPKSIGIFCGVSIHFNLYQLILAAQGIPFLTAPRSSSLILSNFRPFVGRFVGKHLSHPHAKTHPVPLFPLNLW